MPFPAIVNGLTVIQESSPVARSASPRVQPRWGWVVDRLLHVGDGSVDRLSWPGTDVPIRATHRGLRLGRTPHHRGCQPHRLPGNTTDPMADLVAWSANVAVDHQPPKPTFSVIIRIVHLPRSQINTPNPQPAGCKHRRPHPPPTCAQVTPHIQRNYVPINCGTRVAYGSSRKLIERACDTVPSVQAHASTTPRSVTSTTTSCD